MNREEIDKALGIISKAWGRRQKGYCFFPWISGKAKDKKERILSYNEGVSFAWPDERDKILDHLQLHTNDDVYWCPSLFEYRKRRMELATDEHALWADLDAVDPKSIQDYPPTIAWETSPGRYQALWLMNSGDIQGASWPGNENQKLTYHLGADISGWDTTQLLRIPGWTNHKPEYRNAKGGGIKGRLLWSNGRTYLQDDFKDLPELVSMGQEAVLALGDAFEDELDHIDRLKVWGRVRLRVSSRVREMVSSKNASGDRSDVLWEIERELADAGCSLLEIVSIVRETVWNKFAGRSDELRRLTNEAAKAISQRPPEAKERVLEEFKERQAPTNLFEFVKNLKPPTWLIKGVLTEGAVGFIAGQPKSFKSWTALDMALSVASGQRFLNFFTIIAPGPVLYVQEEDSGPTVKSRLDKMWPAKQADRVGWDNETGAVMWYPPEEFSGFPDVDCYISQSVVLSDESWQAWLDETLENKHYHLLVLDPLMMLAGDVEENRAQEMTTKIFRPLKELARKHNTAIQLVHHMRKEGNGGSSRGKFAGGSQRGGQMLLGSVANHAWAEDSLYFRHDKGGIFCEQESKSAQVNGFRISNIRNKSWDPQVTPVSGEEEDEYGSGHQRYSDKVSPSPRPVPKARPESPVLTYLRTQAEARTASQIAKAISVTPTSATNTLRRLGDRGSVIKIDLVPSGQRAGKGSGARYKINPEHKSVIYDGTT